MFQGLFVLLASTKNEKGLFHHRRQQKISMKYDKILTEEKIFLKITRRVYFSVAGIEYDIPFDSIFFLNVIFAF